MNSFLSNSFLLSVGVNALVARDGTCCFGISSPGNGNVGQIGDGQTRLGAFDVEAGSFCIDFGGGITDGEGRGCVLTPETSQFQCDAGKPATRGFSVGSNGLIAYNGSSTFYSCISGGNGNNIYLHDGPDVTNCTEITLIADNCKNIAAPCAPSPSAPAPSVPVPSTSTSAPIESSHPIPSTPASTSPPVESSHLPPSVPSTPVSSSLAVSSAPAPSTPVASSHSATPPTQPSSTIETSSVISVTTTHTLVSITPTTSKAPWSQPSQPPSVPSQPTTSQGSSVPASQPTTSKTPTGSISQPSPSPSTSVSSSVPPTSTFSTSVATPTSSTGTITSNSSPSTSSTCVTPTTLPRYPDGNVYQYPHLILPISSASPSTTFGTVYNGYINSTTSTIFNFDIPTSYSTKRCNLVFLFPQQKDLETSSFTFSGDGALDFKQLVDVAKEGSTSYSNAPATKTDYGVRTVAPGNSYVISSFACPAGQAAGFEVSSVGSTQLEWFNDWNPSPIGLFITTC